MLGVGPVQALGEPDQQAVLGEDDGVPGLRDPRHQLVQQPVEVALGIGVLRHHCCSLAAEGAAGAEGVAGASASGVVARAVRVPRWMAAMVARERCGAESSPDGPKEPVPPTPSAASGADGPVRPYGAGAGVPGRPYAPGPGWPNAAPGALASRNCSARLALRTRCGSTRGVRSSPSGPSSGAASSARW